MGASQADCEGQLKDTAKALMNRINGLHGVVHRIDEGQHFFYSGIPSKKNLFTTFLLTRKALIVRIKTDPAMVFNDPEHWTEEKAFRSCLLLLLGKRQEREFKIEKEDQIEYAMELITQAYMHIQRIKEKYPLDRYNEAMAVLKQGWKRV